VPIRLRVALVFALALAVAFALGGWLFVSQLSAAMLRSTDAPSPPGSARPGVTPKTTGTRAHRR
jgi:hypothetical protein